MKCRFYIIQAKTARGELLWVVAAEDDDKAVDLLPPEGKPCKIIWKTAPVEREVTLVARLRSYDFE